MKDFEKIFANMLISAMIVLFACVVSLERLFLTNEGVMIFLIVFIVIVIIIVFVYACVTLITSSVFEEEK